MVSPANTNPGLTKKHGIRVSRTSTTRPAPQLRPRHRNRRLPGPRGRPCGEVARLQEGVRPERQADLRRRRPPRTYATAAKKLGLQGRRTTGLGCEAVELRGPREPDQGLGRTGRVPRRHRVNNGAKLMQDIKAVNPKIQLPDARTGSSDPERERRGRPTARTSASQVSRRKSLTGFGADVREELRQVDRCGPEPVRRVRRASMLVCCRPSLRTAAVGPRSTRDGLWMHVANGVSERSRSTRQGDTYVALAITIYKQAREDSSSREALTPDTDLDRVGKVGCFDCTPGEACLPRCRNPQDQWRPARAPPATVPHEAIARLLCDAGIALLLLALLAFWFDRQLRQGPGVLLRRSCRSA